MLDKRTAFAMDVITSICKDGSYKIIDKTELLEKISIKHSIDIDGVMQVINHLQNMQLVDVKYSDENVVCVALLPKGRLLSEEKYVNKPKKVKDIFSLVLTFIAAFAGAVIGVLIGGLL